MLNMLVRSLVVALFLASPAFGLETQVKSGGQVYIFLPSEPVNKNSYGLEEHFDGAIDDSGLESQYSFDSDYGLTSNVSGHEPTLSTTETASSPHTLQRSMQANFDVAYNSTMEIKDLDQRVYPDGNAPDKWFVSYYVKLRKLSGVDSRNIKLLRLSTGYSGAYTQPLLGVTLFHNNNNGIFYHYADSSTLSQSWIGMIPMDSWVRLDYYIDMSSSPGVADGSMSLSVNRSQVAQKNSIVTHFGTETFKWATLPYYVAHDPGGQYKIQSDNLAILPGLERLEYCLREDFPSDDRSYSACTMPKVLRPTFSFDSVAGKWTATNPKFNKNNLQEMFVYYFNAAGELLNTDPVRICRRCPDL